MKRTPLRVVAVILSVALLAAPAVAFAGAQAPSREGNVWNWRRHQPTEAQVEPKEKAAGLAPTSPQRETDAATVDHLYRQLLHSSLG
jgi:hypothetical protein